jgi:serine/alanine racemase
MRSNAADGRYGGIDAVKLLAAFLVVAIHTGPLLTYGDYPDFLLTGILARLAVPLFFMASGYLFFRKLKGHVRKDRRALRKYGVRIAVLYGIAIVLYVPLNVYKGDFAAAGMTAGSVIRDVAVDGTFYHLWYLPALWLGIHLVYFLHKKLSVGGVLAVTFALYGIGLLGDSYYGLAIRSELLKGMFDWLFLWFDYTRNGLFFAPVYLALGLWAARRPVSPGVSRSLLPLSFALSLAALYAEGMLLHGAELPRHDSMYVMLLPAVATLFLLALRWNVRMSPLSGAVSQWLYLLHPAAIVAVRGLAGAAGLDWLLVDYSLMHYAAVCGVSLAAAWAVAYEAERRRKRMRRQAGKASAQVGPPAGSA